MDPAEETEKQPGWRQVSHLQGYLRKKVIFLDPVHFNRTRSSFKWNWIQSSKNITSFLFLDYPLSVGFILMGFLHPWFTVLLEASRGTLNSCQKERDCFSLFPYQRSSDTH